MTASFVPHVVRKEKQLRSYSLAPSTGLLFRDSRGHAGLIKGYRDGYLRDTLSQRLQHRVQSRMGDTDRSALQQLQLWRLLYDDGVVRNRSDLLRIDLIAYGKHQLQILMLREGSSDAAEGIQLGIQYKP